MLAPLLFRRLLAATGMGLPPQAKAARLLTASTAEPDLSHTQVVTAAQMVHARALVVVVLLAFQALAQTAATVLAAHLVAALVAVDQTAHLQLQAGHPAAQPAQTVALV